MNVSVMEGKTFSVHSAPGIETTIRICPHLGEGHYIAVMKKLDGKEARRPKPRNREKCHRTC